MKKRVICAAAAALLTGLSSTVFVSAEPANLERRISAAYALAIAPAYVPNAPAQSPATKPLRA